MNSESAAVTAVNLVQQQAVQDVWVGLMQLLQDMAAVYRVRRKLHLQYWMYLVILMSCRYVSVYEIDGEVTRDFPTTHLLKKAKPVYTTLPGWKCDIRGITKYEDLPENCRKYIEFIEKELEVPITMVSMDRVVMKSSNVNKLIKYF